MLKTTEDERKDRVRWHARLTEVRELLHTRPGWKITIKLGRETVWEGINHAPYNPFPYKR